MAGIDLVPDQIAGFPDIGVVPQNPSDPRDTSLVFLAQQLQFPCAGMDLKYITAIQEGVGLGTKHFRISGQPSNVTINEQTGLVVIKADNTCAPGGYTINQFVDAESNGKTQRSNTMQVRLVIR